MGIKSILSNETNTLSKNFESNDSNLLETHKQKRISQVQDPIMEDLDGETRELKLLQRENSSDIE